MSLLSNIGFVSSIILSAYLSSCVGSKTTVPESELSKNTGIVIDTFSDLPPEIEGCSCLFSNNKNDFESGKYIYADDYQGNAFISINGEMKRFTLGNSHKVSDKHFTRTWISEDFDVTLKYKQVGEIEETWQQKGTIKIKSKTGTEVAKEFYGECGC